MTASFEGIQTIRLIAALEDHRKKFMTSLTAEAASPLSGNDGWRSHIPPRTTVLSKPFEG